MQQPGALRAWVPSAGPDDGTSSRGAQPNLCHDRFTLSRVEDYAVLDRLFNYFSPFTVMKDVSRGTWAERAAAVRYNCRHRGCLTTYIQRWLVSGAVALLLTAFFDAMTPHESHVLTIPVVLAACVAMFAT